VADAGDESGQSGRAAAQADGNEGRRGDARQGFFSLRDEGRQASDSSRAKTVNTTAGKNAPEAPTPGAGAGQDAQQAVQQRLEGPSSSRSAEVYRQVENGAFRNLGQGVRQLVIRLDPAELGQISVILQVKGKEVQAVLRASNQETSHALGEQMSQLRAHLESQGLRVSRLEVQTQLADSQQQSQWQGAEQHNRFQENRELALSAQRWRNLGRAEGGLVRDVQTVLHREKLSQDGLDIFA
jgi:flagellar hook-length control protein FliK